MPDSTPRASDPTSELPPRDEEPRSQDHAPQAPAQLSHDEQIDALLAGRHPAQDPLSPIRRFGDRSAAAGGLSSAGYALHVGSIAARLNREVVGTLNLLRDGAVQGRANRSVTNTFIDAVRSSNEALMGLIRETADASNHLASPPPLYEATLENLNSEVAEALNHPASPPPPYEATLENLNSEVAEALNRPGPPPPPYETAVDPNREVADALSRAGGPTPDESRYAPRRTDPSREGPVGRGTSVSRPPSRRGR